MYLHAGHKQPWRGDIIFRENLPVKEKYGTIKTTAVCWKFA